MRLYEGKSLSENYYTLDRDFSGYSKCEIIGDKIDYKPVFNEVFKLYD